MIDLVPFSVATASQLLDHLGERRRQVANAIAKAEKFYDLNCMVAPLKDLDPELSAICDLVNTTPRDLNIRNTVEHANAVIGHCLGHLKNIPERHTLIVYDAEAGAFVQPLSMETRRHKTIYSSVGVEIHPVKSITDIDKALQLFYGRRPALDRLIIHGHGKAGYLWVGGGTDLATKYDNTEKAFSISVAHHEKSGYAVTAGLRSRVNRFGLGNGRTLDSCPVVILAGCNVAYNQDGKNLVELMSRNIFPGCLVVAFADYTQIYRDDADRRTIHWKLGGEHVVPRQARVQDVSAAYNGTLVPWQEYKNNRIIGQPSISGIDSTMETFCVNLGTPRESA